MSLQSAANSSVWVTDCVRASLYFFARSIPGIDIRLCKRREMQRAHQGKQVLASSSGQTCHPSCHSNTQVLGLLLTLLLGGQTTSVQALPYHCDQHRAHSSRKNSLNSLPCEQPSGIWEQHEQRSGHQGTLHSQVESL